MSAPCRFVARKVIVFSSGVQASNLLRSHQCNVSWTIVRQKLTSKKTRPTLYDLWKRRLEAGPEPVHHRSVYPNWNYDSEIFSFGKRLSEDFDEEILKTAFTHRSYVEQQERKLKEQREAAKYQGDESENVQELLGIVDSELLALKGEEITSKYVPAYLRHCLPRLPEECITALHNFLTSEEMLAHIASHLGVKDIILCEEFPPSPSTMKTTFYAVVGALAESQNEARAYLFVQDFVIPQLLDKDLGDIWGEAVHDPMGVLASLLAKEGRGAPEPRLLFESSRGTVYANYQVGIYSDKQLLGRSSGETTTIAEEMAARDALRRAWGTTLSAPPLPLGDKRGKLDVDITARNHSIEDYRMKQVESSSS